MRNKTVSSLLVALTLMGLNTHKASAITLEQYIQIRDKAYDKNNKDNQSAKAALVFYLEGIAEGEGYSRINDVYAHKDNKAFKPYACVPPKLLMDDKLVSQFVEIYLAGENPDMKRDVALVYTSSLRRLYPCDKE